MKNKITLFVLLFHSVIFFAQEKSFPELMETDTSWGKEIFEFPIRFAQEINYYKGFEEAKFPKGWSNRDTLTFWTYAFAWSIEHESEITAAALEKDLQLYFDGLADIKGRRKNGVYIPNTVVLFLNKDKSNFVGKIRTFDSFTTKRLFTLNVLVEKKYCEQNKKSILLFKFSPKEFGHEVWDILNEVEIRDEVCTH